MASQNFSHTQIFASTTAQSCSTGTHQLLRGFLQPGSTGLLFQLNSVPDFQCPPPGSGTAATTSDRHQTDPMSPASLGIKALREEGSWWTPSWRIPSDICDGHFCSWTDYLFFSNRLGTPAWQVHNNQRATGGNEGKPKALLQMNPAADHAALTVPPQSNRHRTTLTLSNTQSGSKPVRAKANGQMCAIPRHLSQCGHPGVSVGELGQRLHSYRLSTSLTVHVMWLNTLPASSQHCDGPVDICGSNSGSMLAKQLLWRGLHNGEGYDAANPNSLVLLNKAALIPIL